MTIVGRRAENGRSKYIKKTERSQK
uniref:Uncharacterized protein n=1 Tax=Anguilla anguilla TaxID=7936 RepID=A0A0E9TB08_ANGAN